MLTILAFILTLLGSVNWLLIGLLQYDFVAGIFGYQGSVFSRLIYIIIGASSVVLVVKLFKGKGSIPIITRRNKSDVQKQVAKIGHKQENIEAGKDMLDDHFGQSRPDQDSEPVDETKQGLFDQELKD